MGEEVAETETEQLLEVVAGSVEVAGLVEVAMSEKAVGNPVTVVDYSASEAPGLLLSFPTRLV